jgi:hypothetical protein
METNDFAEASSQQGLQCDPFIEPTNALRSSKGMVREPENHFCVPTVKRLDQKYRPVVYDCWSATCALSNLMYALHEKVHRREQGF